MRPLRPGAPGARRDFRPGPRGRARRRRRRDKEAATRPPPADPGARPPAAPAPARSGGHRCRRRRPVGSRLCECGATEGSGSPSPRSRTAAECRARRRRPAGAKRGRPRGLALKRAPPGGTARPRGRRHAPPHRLRPRAPRPPPDLGPSAQWRGPGRPRPPLNAHWAWRSNRPRAGREAPRVSFARRSKSID